MAVHPRTCTGSNIEVLLVVAAPEVFVEQGARFCGQGIGAGTLDMEGIERCAGVPDRKMTVVGVEIRVADVVHRGSRGSGQSLRCAVLDHLDDDVDTHFLQVRLHSLVLRRHGRLRLVPKRAGAAATRQRNRASAARYHGVFAPNSPLRRAIVPGAGRATRSRTGSRYRNRRPERTGPRTATARRSPGHSDSNASSRLTLPSARMVVDQLRVIADVTDSDVIRKILNHILQRAPPRQPPRRASRRLTAPGHVAT